MSQSSNPSGSINNRGPFYSPPVSLDYRPENDGIQRRPYKILFRNALDLLNDLLKQLDNKDHHILCTKYENIQLEVNKREKETYIMELEGEIIRFKEKVTQFEEQVLVQSAQTAAENQAFMAAIADLKIGGLRRYMEHLDYRTAVMLPASAIFHPTGQTHAEILA